VIKSNRVVWQHCTLRTSLVTSDAVKHQTAITNTIAESRLRHKLSCKLPKNLIFL